MSDDAVIKPIPQIGYHAASYRTSLSVGRCYWAVSIVLAFFMSCALSILLYNRFAEMPTRIAVENQYASIHDVPYPAITICSPNQITISSLEHFEKTLVLPK
ncbi:jg16554 [Pararge aegeria aegeria]|uniref:Jg16554 protein n=1 Tax=Pararge aegeria aegeria TaxID=348720 RepID=A0A8S4R0U1_9NEOP|nr:jg16554 [Pararge aegeria aegeria]